MLKVLTVLISCSEVQREDTEKTLGQSSGTPNNSFLSNALDIVLGYLECFKGSIGYF